MVERESLGELFGELANKSSILLRDEIELAKQEMGEKFISLKVGAAFMIAGAWIASLAGMTLVAAAVIGLAPRVGLANSALIVGGALLLVAAVVTLLGMSRLKKRNLKPEQTIEMLREDKEWLKELT
jgi:hypothetical protein